MSKTQVCKSEALSAIYETISELYQIDAIDKKTKRGFDVSCLKPAKMTAPQEIKVRKS